jgi:hypothetical protein
MKRLLIVFGVLLPLLGCDDPTARQYLAQCKLEPAAQVPNFSHYTIGYLGQCMQAKGYVEDGELVAYGKKCADLLWSAEIATCYRPDNEMARLLYENF